MRFNLTGEREVLMLSEGEVASLISMGEAISAVERAFRNKYSKKVQMPPKPYLFFDKAQGDLRVMPSFIPSLGLAAVKIVNSHPQNPSRFGIPSVVGTLFVVDPEDGRPVAIMGANYLTSLRTGAAGAIAARYMSPENPEVVGLIGAGIQSRTQLQGLMEVFRGLRYVRVFDLDQDKAGSLVKEHGEDMDIEFEMSSSAEEAVEGADLVVTTTPSRTPILRSDWIDNGTHINAIGADAPGKQELEISLLRRAHIVVDDWDQASHGGEINSAVEQGILAREDIRGELSEVILGQVKGRQSRDEVTVFDSTGLAIQDLAVGAKAYRKARALGIGHEIDIWRL